MNRSIRYLFLALFFLISVPSVSAEEYRTFGQFTGNEIKKINEARVGYNRCLNEFALSRLEQQGDPRVVADHAMKHCAADMEELHDYFVANDFAPEASRKFTNGIVNRASNKLLSNLMMFMAAPKK